MKTQQIIAYDTTDDDCNGVDLITILKCVSTVLPVSTVIPITRSRAIEEVMLVATTTATTTEVMNSSSRKQLHRGQTSMIWKKSKSRLIPELED